MNTNSPTGASQSASAQMARNGHETPKSTAAKLLAKGLWPVPIKAGEKRPIGRAWGEERRALDSLNQAYLDNPGAGVGVCLGPGRGPRGSWLIDLEGDGDQAEESYTSLVGGECINTLGWTSARGRHRLFRADGQRLLRLLAAAGATEGKGASSGVYKLPEFPGLEMRIGGLKPDGQVKQLQSVCPPTPGTDGKPREWTGDVPAELPDIAYGRLEMLAERRSIKAEQPAVQTSRRDGKASSVEDRARAYARKISPAISGQGGHDRTFYAACKLGPGFDLPEDLAFRILSEEYNPRCEPPWTVEELRHKIRDAYTGNPQRGFLLEDGRGNGHANGHVNRIFPSPNGTNGKGKHFPNIDARLAGYPKTDLGNAERLVARHGDKIRFCHPWGKWLVFDGRRWAIDQTAAVARLAKDTVRRMYAEAMTLDDSGRTELVSWGLKTEKRDRLSAMIDLASKEDGIAIMPDDLDKDPWAFNVANGTIDLRTGKLRPHDQADFISQLCPTPYDPSAECERWDSTLNLFFDGDAQLIAYWQRICGCAMAGAVRDHVLPIAYGTGSNGKSTILGALLDVFGPDYAMKAPLGMLMASKGGSHSTERADLFRKRLVAAIETDDGERIAETLIKELTGGDRIRARRLYEDNWEFTPTHTIVMATNHKPEVRGTDKGIWRRLKLVPFNVSVEGQTADLDMPAKLRAELPGILRWCVVGCLEWQSKGLDEPETVTRATSEYRSEQNVIGRFLDECMLRNPGLRARCGLVYERYKSWAQTGGEQVLSMTKFGGKMKELGYPSEGTSAKSYSGLGLKDEDKQDGTF